MSRMAWKSRLRPQMIKMDADAATLAYCTITLLCRKAKLNVAWPLKKVFAMYRNRACDSMLDKLKIASDSIKITIANFPVGAWHTVLFVLKAHVICLSM